MNGVCGGSAVQVERGGGGTTFVSAVERDMDCLPRTPTGGFLAALRSRSIFDTSGSLMPAPGRVLSENTKRNECKGRLQMACVQQVGVQMACVQQVGGGANGQTTPDTPSPSSSFSRPWKCCPEHGSSPPCSSSVSSRPGCVLLPSSSFSELVSSSAAVASWTPKVNPPKRRCKRVSQS